MKRKEIYLVFVLVGALTFLSGCVGTGSQIEGSYSYTFTERDNSCYTQEWLELKKNGSYEYRVECKPPSIGCNCFDEGVLTGKWTEEEDKMIGHIVTFKPDIYRMPCGGVFLYIEEDNGEIVLETLDGDTLKKI